MAQALLVARLRLLDASRDRRAFLTGLILPFVMIAVFAVIGVFGAKAQARSEAPTVKVAVDRGVLGTDRLLGALRSDAIEVVRADDPAALVVRDRADVWLSLPPYADAILASARPLQAEVLAGPDGRAAEAVATTEAALRRLALEAGGHPPEVRITTDRLENNPKAAASALARTVPLLALVITVPFLGAGVRALTNSRGDRTIEHLLPLPIPRGALLLGLAAGTIGGEAVQQLLMLGILAIAAPALAAAGAIPWSGPVVLLLSLLTSALTAGSLGILMGVFARSERLVGVVFGLTSTLLFSCAVVLQFIDRTPNAPTFTAIPLFGPVLAARAAFTSAGVSALAVATMIAGGLVVMFGALRLAVVRLAAGGGLRV